MKSHKYLAFIYLWFISILGYAYLALLPFPHKTDSSLNILFSLILFLFCSFLFWKNLLSNNLFDLQFLFNSTWIFSISLALLALSKVQNDLTIDFLIFLFFVILFFNLGYYIKLKPSNPYDIKLPSRPNIYDSAYFKLGGIIVLVICVGGYIYQIQQIGFIPILKAQEEGFYDNRAGFLSIIHYFSTSLGGLAGMYLAFFVVTKKSKLFYLIIGLIALVGAASLLAKNILFITFFTFVSILIFYKKLFLKNLILIGATSAGILLLSSAIRTGSDSYIKIYSQIEYDNLPSFFYWINTYFAINISHLNTYFNEGYSATYGTKSIGLLTSLLFVRTKIQELLGPEIVHYNGLGGYINVVPMLYSYLTDFGIAGFTPMIIIGRISRWVTDRFRNSNSIFYAFLYGGFAYILGLSVFGDFLNRLMIPVNIVFLSIPYLIFITLRKVKI